MVVIPSIWGHWAGGPGSEDGKWINERLKEFGL